MVAKSKKQKKDRAKKEDFFFQAAFAVVILFLAGFLIVSNYRLVKRRRELTEKISVLTQRIEDLDEERQELEQGILETQKDTYWEERVREQGYVREGEEQVVVLGPDNVEKEEVAQEQGFFSNFLANIRSFFERITQ